ncbi:tetratricopeptide repeat protein [Caloramator sp. mosi_1]|uniref:tetratricopeptide repeat protein n=1 Tax=Caloramator sp. mosi_1 TaxID=3023090 RepID=UPI00235EA98A|nr:tetratricopeptide repeat protein [Caloramator sp. mosi_1]WDC84205.1 tetratricopeptide repeat protein [Caloramator sp. mosi_1]
MNFNKTGLDFKDEIEKSLKEVLNINENNAIANYNLALLYLDIDMDLAKYHFRKCIHNELTRERAQEMIEKIEAVENYDKAVELIKLENYQEALKILIHLYENNPDNLDVIYYIAVCYRNLGLNEKALMYLYELYSKLEVPEVNIEIGLNLASLGYYQEALRYFKDALKLKPNDSSIICNIGVCYLYLNETQKAKESFELALKIDKDDKIAKSGLRKYRVTCKKAKNML